MSIATDQSLGSPSVIDAGNVRVGAGPMRIPLPSERTSAGPKVELMRDGDAIVGAIVTCPCGEKVRLQFDFTKAS